MNERRLRQLADDLSAELQDFQTIKTAVQEAYTRIVNRVPDVYDLYAMGGILHDVYRGAESICLQIAKAIDARIPEGNQWHRDLLEQMAKPVAKTRPAIIRATTFVLLDDYRKFRHRYRNIYGSELDWELMRPLLERAFPTIEAFTEDIEQFVAFLRLEADESE